ncbi:transaldolase [Kordiimonas pumila]|uniref:Transaldolase n=1 Tax=Kordiimonas pumila TaxID=2161677 RepID=A0ABV7D944_9PROT|nr:transaldolase [Kordiimonas pumila]
MTVCNLKVKIFADGADFDDICMLNKNPRIEGFTTNPTLMRQAGVSDYEAFAHKVLAVATDKPVSFEVFADDLPSMEAQAREIASWGQNVNVKIPVTTTKGEFTGPILKRLTADGVQVNVTALMTVDQVRAVAAVLSPTTPAIVSVFAGRIADTGLDPVPYMQEAATVLAALPKADLLWASPREVLNIYQADAVGCGIITVTHSLLKKLDLYGKDLVEYSLETVAMFYNDASAATYQIRVKAPKDCEVA